MMYLAYSALRNKKAAPVNKSFEARYKGYQEACKKHRDTIEAIRQYLPGWEPQFRP